eukprot:scaffold18507_cov188-Amphora_coffeaeformis.AAC.1
MLRIADGSFVGSALPNNEREVKVFGVVQRVRFFFVATLGHVRSSSSVGANEIGTIARICIPVDNIREASVNEHKFQIAISLEQLNRMIPRLFCELFLDIYVRSVNDSKGESNVI